jgi:hypothetical protein
VHHPGPAEQVEAPDDAVHELGLQAGHARMTADQDAERAIMFIAPLDESGTLVVARTAVRRGASAVAGRRGRSPR